MSGQLKTLWEQQLHRARAAQPPTKSAPWRPLASCYGALQTQTCCASAVGALTLAIFCMCRPSFCCLRAASALERPAFSWSLALLWSAIVTVLCVAVMRRETLPPCSTLVHE